MQYLLIDTNPKMVAAWKLYFEQEKNVKIVHGDLTNAICDSIVSPANSFGFMDGGVDYFISERLGWDLQIKLQKEIKALPEQELMVGRAMVIPTNDELIPYLISAPTMRVPMNFNIATSVNPYLAMKAALLVAKENTAINEIAIPGFCTGVGKMPFEIAALQMHKAFCEIEKGEKLDFKDFGEAQRHQRSLNPDTMIFG